MAKSEKEALLSAANDFSEHGVGSAASSFYHSQQTPSVLENLLQPQHSIQEEFDDQERDSGFSSRHLSSEDDK